MTAPWIQKLVRIPCKAGRPTRRNTAWLKVHRITETYRTLQATALMMIVIAGLVALKLEIWVPNAHH